MALEARLEKWHRAGLLAKEQVDAILDFESRSHRPLFAYAVAALGGLAIAIGAVAIVASNWDAIPPAAKLVCDLLLLCVGAVAVVWLAGRGHRAGREVSILVLSGLVLASIALVGQVYQLGGEAHKAMAVWCCLTALLMSRAQSSFVAVVWLAALETTYGLWLVELPKDWAWSEGIALAGVPLAPLCCLLLGTSTWLSRVRPSFASVFLGLGWVQLVLVGSVGTFAFYQDMRHERLGALYFGLAISLVLALAIWRRLSTSRARMPAGALLLGSLLTYHLPLLVSPGGWDIAAAASFIALWLVVALAAHQQGRVRELNFATAVVGVRILTVYFEIFGSLLNTGLGLVSGGALTLVLVWAWARKRRHFARDLSSGLGGSSG